MIHLSGFTEQTENQPEGDIEIKVTGLRPGEKLYEELLIGDNVIKTEHPKIMRARENMMAFSNLNTKLTALKAAYDSDDTKAIRDVLLETVDGFEPQCDVQDWLL
jgi:FlaA1/EpsC-like NDP-sugar epimerase